MAEITINKSARELKQKDIANQ